MSAEPGIRVAADGPLTGEELAAVRSARRVRHERALNHAGAARLAHFLRPYGILRREVLEEVAGARHWGAGAFDQALDAAVKEGLMRHIGFGFYQAIL